MLDACGLLELASICPRLNLLLLGGSSLNLQALAATNADATSGKNPDNYGGFKLIEIIDAASLTFPFPLCKSQGSQETSFNNGRHLGIVSLVTAAVEASPFLQKRSENLLLVRMASVLTILSLALPELLAVELSFLPVAALVSQTLKSLEEGFFDGYRMPEVWDLTRAECVRKATAALVESRRLASASQGDGTSAFDDHEALALALRCAVGCSSAARATPLHCAVSNLGRTGTTPATPGRDPARIAEQRPPSVSRPPLARGEADSKRRQPATLDADGRHLLDGLIQLGAVLDARDAGGATALFHAAELGSAGEFRRRPPILIFYGMRTEGTPYLR